MNDNTKKKILIITGIIALILLYSFLIHVVSAEETRHPTACDKTVCLDGTETPLTEYSYFKDLNKQENKKQFVITNQPVFYKTNSNELQPIDTNFYATIGFPNIYYSLKNLHKLYVSSNGWIQTTFNNNRIQLHLKSIGFYNTDLNTYQTFPITLSNPTIYGNTITWQLPLDSNYSITNNRGQLKDIIVIGLPLKEYFKNNKPNTWTLENTLIGLIYDINFLDSTPPAFNTQNTINFNKTLLRSGYAENSDYNHGFNGMDFNTNEWLHYKRTRIYLPNKNLLLDVTDLNSIYSPQGTIQFNLTEEFSLNDTNQDGREINNLLGDNTFDATNTSITFTQLNQSDYAGIIFPNISIPKDTLIYDANLTAQVTPDCDAAGGCNTRIFGIAADDLPVWSNTHLPSSETFTTAATDYNATNAFIPNSTYEIKDFNVTLQIMEITSRAGWVYDNNMGFAIDPISIARFNNQTFRTYDVDTTAWKLTVNFELDPCQPIPNFNWTITDQNLYCENYNNMNTEDGNLLITSTGFLSLIHSKLLLGQKITLQAKQYWNQQYTGINTPTQITTDSNAITSDNLRHTTTSYNYHSTAAGTWISAQNTNDHFIEIDLGQPYNTESCLIPIVYQFNRFTDLNVTFDNGTGDWQTLYINHDFDMNETGNGGDCNSGGGYIESVYYCDMNLSVNQPLQKIKIMVEHDSKIAGATANGNSYFGANNIVCYTKQADTIKLNLLDSNYSIRN